MPKISAEDSVLKIGIVAVFILLLISGVYLFLKNNSAKDVRTNTVVDSTGKVSGNTDQSNWQTYRNEEFGYYLKHPPRLYKRDLGSAGGYLDFMRFEENQFSSGYGIAVGVRENSLSQEVENIKNEFDELGGAELVEETNISVNSIEGVRLLYKPNEGETGENRVIVILNNGKYSYSVSTVPEQINQVLEGFGFLQ